MVFERMYRAQRDATIKERMLLVLNVVYYGKVAAHVAKDIHRSKGWTTYWLKRYDEEGMEGLKDRPKSGRHPELPKEIEYRIKTTLRESNQGWTTKQVEELIIRESGVNYNHNYIYTILHRWGFRQKVPRKVHVNTASKEEKKEFKKRPSRYLWMYKAKKNLL
jgi:transposase